MALSRLMLIPEAIPDGFVACNRAWDTDSHAFYGFSRVKTCFHERLPKKVLCRRDGPPGRPYDVAILVFVAVRGRPFVNECSDALG